MFKGLLFTTDFLQEGIQHTTPWQNVSEEDLTAFKVLLTRAFATVTPDIKMVESATEEALIEPTLRALGWQQYSRGITAAASGRADVPDFVLFEDEDAKAKALAAEAGEAYRHGLSVLEAKKWLRQLDRAPSARTNTEKEVPSTQILRYLSRVETLSDRRIQFGILTNGRLWRLYWQGARSRSEEYLEIDLPLALGLPGYQPEFTAVEADADHALKVFLVLFGRAAFLPFNAARQTFHQFALDETRHWETRVTNKLSEAVFNDVFPALVRGLASHDDAAKVKSPAYREEVRQAALTLLYRLLFILYAEDRELLPIRSNKYDDYALRKVREEVKTRLDAGDALSGRSSTFYSKVLDLCEGIDKGDSEIGLPPYNGGLFDSKRSPLLARVKLPDNVMAHVVDGLSRTTGEGRNAQKQWINYRDLSVQQLGSIYERLLEFRLVADGESIDIEPNAFARKTSGSYYTPEILVRLVLEQAVGPLILEKLNAFFTALEQGKPTPELTALDPASAILDLKICDPAMGSGHFLVSLVDYLSDEIHTAISEAESNATLKGHDDYHSPLLSRLEKIRSGILHNAEEHGWDVNPEHLENRHLIRRMVLKKVIYGVDKNPMAVELAKLSLWLHTFTVGAPLSFLDHHLRCGDSLFGEWVGKMVGSAAQPLFVKHLADEATASAKDMQGIEDAPDAEIAGVKNSASMFAKVQAHTQRLYRLMHLIQAQKWMANSALASVVDGIVNGQFSRTRDGQSPLEAFLIEKPSLWEKAVNATLSEIEELIADENFLHWEVAFPGVWTDWQKPEPVGGFDAVIGNPPWDRMKLQEVEWFAERKPAIAMQPRAADRKRMIKDEIERETPLGKQYLLAKHRAERAVELARTSGEYPLMSGGDINIYSLFVERAHKLVKPTGIVSLVTPSGIYADKTASPFFKSISTSGRLASLFDFENRGRAGTGDNLLFFADVDSRFKFTVLTAGGKSRTFAASLCGFQLKQEEVTNTARCFNLLPEDFSRLNPNTGTAPMLLNRRDAEITRTVYARVPVLVQHTDGGMLKTWPVSYHRMFDMTNDSQYFKSPKMLADDGAYPVELACYRKGQDVLFRPLYEGKVFDYYNHRASNIVVNAANLKRAAVKELAEVGDLQNPSWFPAFQYWVDDSDIAWKHQWDWVVSFKTVSSPTNSRTIVNAILPKAAFGNSCGLLFNASDTVKYPDYAPLLSANLSSFVMDYFARAKVHGNNVNWFIVEQLPVLAEADYQRKFGKETAADVVKRHVLELTYTAHDLEPFARDLGYTGQPFAWDEERRRHLRARLDALYFHLYGLSLDEAAYVMDTFPIVRKNDEGAFGRYLTKELIIGYYKALSAGDNDRIIVIK